LISVDVGRDAASAIKMRWCGRPRRRCAGETVRKMRDGVTRARCGPGKVLAGMVRRIDAGLQVHALADQAALEQALAAVRGG
jgi:hypothetical protein